MHVALARGLLARQEVDDELHDVDVQDDVSVFNLGRNFSLHASGPIDLTGQMSQDNQNIFRKLLTRDKHLHSNVRINVLLVLDLHAYLQRLDKR